MDMSLFTTFTKHLLASPVLLIRLVRTALWKPPVCTWSRQEFRFGDVNTEMKKKLQDNKYYIQFFRNFQELYLQQTDQIGNQMTTACPLSKCRRGRSDSGYQTVGDVSRENSVAPNGTEGVDRQQADEKAEDMTEISYYRSEVTDVEQGAGALDKTPLHSSVCEPPSESRLTTTNTPPPTESVRVHQSPRIWRRLQSENFRLYLHHQCSNSSSADSAQKSKAIDVSSSWNSDDVWSSEQDYCQKRYNGRRRSVKRPRRHPSRSYSQSQPNYWKSSDKRYRGRSMSFLDLAVLENRSRSRFGVWMPKKIRHSFDDVTHLLTRSVDSLLSFSTCNSYEFDDVFVAYTEDELWPNPAIDRPSPTSDRPTLMTAVIGDAISDTKMNTPSIRVGADHLGKFDVSKEHRSGGFRTNHLEPPANLSKYKMPPSTAKWRFDGLDDYLSSKKATIAQSATAMLLQQRGEGGRTALQNRASRDDVNIDSQKINIDITSALRNKHKSSSTSSLEDISSNLSQVEYDSVQESRNVGHLSIRTPGFPTTWKESDSGSFVSFAESDVPYNIELTLREKKRISNHPVKCLLRVKYARVLNLIFN